MKFVAVTCVKNEIDIIEAFVRHTLAVVDHVVVLDNGSQDGTGDVLRALEKEGLPLDVVEDPSLGKYQSQRMTSLMHEWAIGRHDADWVLALDGDEFLVLPNGCPLVPDAIDRDRPISIPWRTYVPDDDDDPSQLNPVLRIRRRRVADRSEPRKVMVPRSLADLPNASLAQGNHDLFVNGQRREPCPHRNGYLAHFPLRSRGQYAAKIAINSLQYQAMADRSWEWAFHYKELFALLKQGMQAFTAGFTKVALHYAMPPEAHVEPSTVSDPVLYLGGPLRYTTRVDDTTMAWCAILSYSEDLARRYAVLAAGLTDDQRLESSQQATLVASLYDQLEQQRRSLTQSVLTAAERDEQQKERAANMDAQLEEARRQVALLQQSWTWQIGRLVVGPMAWAKRSRQRCSRALAYLRPHASRGENAIPNLETPLAHSSGT